MVCEEKGVWLEIQYLTLTLWAKKVYQLPSSKVPLYVELLAGQVLGCQREEWVLVEREGGRWRQR